MVEEASKFHQLSKLYNKKYENIIGSSLLGHQQDKECLTSQQSDSGSDAGKADGWPLRIQTSTMVDECRDLSHTK